VWGDGLNSATKVRTEQQRREGVKRGKCRNPHPTVKPIALVRHLATLLLPPSEYAPRRLLVPFAGVASEMIGAVLAGWDYVLGIEMGAAYCDIGTARLEHWCQQPPLL
jgi:site-specific DNA-methyltransferase (adenine-specific)